MNQSQIKHARERASIIHNRAQEQLRARFKEREVSFSLQQKLAALKKGEFKVKKATDDYSWGCVDNYIVFTGEVAFPMKEHATAMEKLRKEYDTLIDELVMGDQSAALELLRRFEAAHCA